MAVEIRETIVTPIRGGVLVQLFVSDAPREAEDAAIRLTLAAKVADFETPLLGHFQRAAMKVAQEALSTILQKTATEIQKAGTDLEPREKRPLPRQRDVP